MGKLKTILVLIPLVLGGVGAIADEPIATQEHFVYTNADLERLDPIPTQDAPIAGGDLGWEFVRDVLEQHYSRLDANRQHQLSRIRAEAEARAEERRSRRDVYRLPYAPYISHRQHSGAHRKRTLHHGNASSPWPVPLHARSRTTLPGS